MDSFQPGAAASRPVNRLELSISCKDLMDMDWTSKSDPFVAVFQGKFGMSSTIAGIGPNERGEPNRYLKIKDAFTEILSFIYLIPLVQSDRQRHELGRTETIQDNLNPVFEKKLIVDYFFEERQVW